jgi:hypothetical protein
VMVMAVICVLRLGLCGSALFQRDSGDLTLRTLTLGRRGGSRPPRTAWPMRPGRPGLAGWSVPAFLDTELGCQLTELPIS